VRLKGGAVRSSAAHFEHLIAESARQVHAERLPLIMDALPLIERGPYLGGADSEWIRQRGVELEELRLDATAEAAELSFTSGVYEQAERLAHEVLTADPAREGCWRLLMRIHGALGEYDKSIAVFLRCRAELADLGLEPSPATLSASRNMRHSVAR
jgi:DNA-binding SARP family transcriptional activator